MLDMNLIEIMQELKQKLGESIPVFNILTTQLSDNEITKAYNIVGKKLNAQVEYNDKEGIVNILKEYKKFKDI